MSFPERARVSLEKGQLSVVEHDHGIACRRQSAAAETGFGPDDFPGGRIEASEFGGPMGRAMNRIHMIPNEDTWIEIPFQIFLLPDNLWFSSFTSGLDPDRAGGGGKEDAVSDHNWVGGVDITARFPGKLGGCISGDGIEKKQRLRREEQMIGTWAACAEGNDGGVSRGSGRTQPKGFTGFPIQRDASASDVQQDSISVEKGRAGKAPLRQRDLVVPNEITGPDLFPGFQIEAMDVTLFTESIDRTLVDRRSRGRSPFIVEWVERTGIGVLPEHFSGLRREAPDRVRLDARERSVAHRENTITAHGDAAESDADLRFPADREFAGEWRRDDFSGSSVVVRTPPVRPVRRLEGSADCEGE